MNWPLLRIYLLVAALVAAFNLGRLSIEFSGTGLDWTLFIFGIVTLIVSLIGLAAGELVRPRN
jgi:uncharacterized membrane protein YtjA (UPF0391 family)